MNRTPLRERTLPAYTGTEELLNSLTHGVGAVFAVCALVLCILSGVHMHSAWAIVSGSVYGASMILMYAVSCVYHSLRPGMGKKVMQIIDHCIIYFFIAGSYLPVLLCSVRMEHSTAAWSIFAFVCAFCVLATVLNAIDLKKYSFISMAFYLCVGWCILAATRIVIRAVSGRGFVWLLSGGVAYTVGALFYGLGRRKRYAHTLFHVFVLVGCALQFICIYGYALV